jgi:L-serine dehydratase
MPAHYLPAFLSRTMQDISVLNDVIGPVMRGPSSSHTAAAYHLAALVRSLLGEEPAEAECIFDSEGSYGRCYRAQGSDLAFAAALMGWPITDDRFREALALAPAHGLQVAFGTERLPQADHPNYVRMRLRGRSGRTLEAEGRSVGGGAVEIATLGGWPIFWTGKTHLTAVEAQASVLDRVREVLGAMPTLAVGMSTTAEGSVMPTASVGMAPPTVEVRGDEAFCWIERRTALTDDARRVLQQLPGVRAVWCGAPVFFVAQGLPLFNSGEAMLAAAERGRLSLGEVAVRYEAELLGLSEAAVLDESLRRFRIMQAAAERGLETDLPPMQLLRPTAAAIFAADAAGRLAVGGLHTRAAARAMAAMHVNCGMGVVCAAPTAGSAGVLPGVLTTLLAERGVEPARIARGLMAAGAIGLIVARRATFAAEVAGCQVEIGAAGAMAAAAVVDIAGGTARQAADAAAIAFQNTMGSVCDLVQGIVEIPCHTRNAAAASSAFVCADLILGGYDNPIPLDETIDAVYAVGRAMPAELRVTSLGGLAVCPSACGMKRLGR